MNQTAQSWLERSSYDFDTARAMLESGRYLYVLFCCQQAVEKALKAIIVSKTDTMPPRIHNLLSLADSAEIELSDERRKLLADLSVYYIQSRYPDEIRKWGAEITRKMASELLSKTEETKQWMLSMIK